MKNYLYSVSYGVFGSLALVSLMWIDMTAKWHEPPEYAGMLFTIVLIAALIICVIAMILNILNLRHTEDKVQTALGELVVTVFTAVVFFLIWAKFIVILME